MSEIENENPETPEEEVVETPETTVVDVAETEMLDDDFSEIGKPPLTLDKSKDPVRVAVPFKTLKKGGPYMFVTVDVQPMTEEGKGLVIYRKSQIWVAHHPDGCSTEAGGVCATSSHSFRDPESGQWRSASTGGLGINKPGLRFFFKTEAAKKAFEKAGFGWDGEFGIEDQIHNPSLRRITKLHDAYNALSRERWANRTPQRQGGRPVEDREAEGVEVGDLTADFD